MALSRRRRPTVVAVGLVAAVGAAALRAAGATVLLVVSRPDCRVETLTVPDLGRAPVAACASRPGRPGRVVSFAWLTDTRLLAIVRSAGTRAYALAEFDGGRLLCWLGCFEDLRWVVSSRQLLPPPGRN